MEIRTGRGVLGDEERCIVYISSGEPAKLLTVQLSSCLRGDRVVRGMQNDQSCFRPVEKNKFEPDQWVRGLYPTSRVSLKRRISPVVGKGSVFVVEWFLASGRGIAALRLISSVGLDLGLGSAGPAGSSALSFVRLQTTSTRKRQYRLVRLRASANAMRHAT